MINPPYTKFDHSSGRGCRVLLGYGQELRPGTACERHDALNLSHGEGQGLLFPHCSGAFDPLVGDGIRRVLSRKLQCQAPAPKVPEHNQPVGVRSRGIGEGLCRLQGTLSRPGRQTEIVHEDGDCTAFHCAARSFVCLSTTGESSRRTVARPAGGCRWRRGRSGRREDRDLDLFPVLQQHEVLGTQVDYRLSSAPKVDINVNESDIELFGKLGAYRFLRCGPVSPGYECDGGSRCVLQDHVKSTLCCNPDASTCPHRCARWQPEEGGAARETGAPRLVHANPGPRSVQPRTACSRPSRRTTSSWPRDIRPSTARDRTRTSR